MDHVSNVLRNYNLAGMIQSIEPLSETGKNNHLLQIITDEQRYILKHQSSPMYAKRKALDYEIQLLQHFDQQIDTFSFPVPLATNSGDWFVSIDDKFFVLLPYVEGTALDFRSPQGIARLARIYATMHTVAEQIASTDRTLRPVPSPFHDFFDFASPDRNPRAISPKMLGITKPDEPLERQIAFWNEQASLLQHFIETDYASLPQLICHNDITPSNILVGDDAIIRLLDFEFMTFGARAFDLATGLRYVMRIWEDRTPWQSIRLFFDVYCDEHRLTQGEVVALPTLLQLRAAIAIIWWLQQGHQSQQVIQLLAYYETFIYWLQANYQQLCNVIADCTSLHCRKN